MLNIDDVVKIIESSAKFKRYQKEGKPTLIAA